MVEADVREEEAVRGVACVCEGRGVVCVVCARCVSEVREWVCVRVCGLCVCESVWLSV